MSGAGPSGGPPTAAGRGPAEPGESTVPTADPGYGTVARLFHWATVVMVVVMLPVGVVMTSELFQPWADPLYILHKGLGSVILALVVARLGWKLLAPGPTTLPRDASPTERRLARWTHGALYGLLLLQAGSGYLRTVGAGYPIELLDLLGIPPLVPEMPGVASVLVVVHKVSAFALTALVAAHVAAVVQHTLARRGDALGRMWPPVRRSRP